MNIRNADLETLEELRDFLQKVSQFDTFYFMPDVSTKAQRFYNYLKSMIETLKRQRKIYSETAKKKIAGRRKVDKLYARERSRKKNEETN